MLILIIINISFITIIPITAQLNQTLEQTAGGNVTSTIKPQGTASYYKTKVQCLIMLLKQLLLVMLLLL